MSPYTIVLTLVAYLTVLLILAHIAGRKADNEGFFIGSRRTSWWMATLAMIGAAMSGVTYISLPGSVATDSFSYMQMVVGFTIGQMIVAFLLTPLFYREKITSLYEYLNRRFSAKARRAGAWCFIIAKLIGAALKIYVVCAVMQLLIFDYFSIHFIWNILFTMLLVWAFTRRGGVRSLIITDILQSACLVVSIVVVIYYISQALGFNLQQMVTAVKESPYSQMWFFDDASSPRYFWKMVAGGALCLVAMTGLDQDMMQRNLSCRTKRDAQINIVLTSICQIGVILLFLALGALLYRYADFANVELPATKDGVFPQVAVRGGLPAMVGILFILGLVSSTYSAAGSALTSLTTAFTLDILSIEGLTQERVKRRRNAVHSSMAVVMAALIILFYTFGEGSVINLVFKIAGYTYGPILGMFTFGILSKRKIRGALLGYVIILAPVLSYLLQWLMASKWEYYIGFELLGYNAIFTIFGLILISYKADEKN